MLPVVPKVRVGDVLYATRNLRNWLQTASLMYSVKHVHDGGSLRGSKSVIYAPKRKDRYVVCVNAGLVFAVFVPERELTLFFVNTVDSRAGKEALKKQLGFVPSVHYAQPGASRPAPGANYQKKKKSKRDTGTRMSPSLFSTWFVRSDERIPDLRQWPDQSYAAWVSLQMNAISVNGEYGLAVSIPRQYDSLFYRNMGGLGNFGSGKRSKDRSTVRTCLQYAIKVGMTREDHQTGHFSTMMMGRSFGPCMEDIDKFRKDIQKWVKNPRIRKNLEAELTAVEVGDDAIKQRGGTKAINLNIRRILDGIQKND